MDSIKKAYWIIGCCIFLVAVSTGLIFVKSILDSDIPYENLDMEQAMEYMEYEEDYKIVDARLPRQYAESHIPGAVNIPVDDVKELASDYLPDKEQMIYVYGSDDQESRKASRMLCKMKYINITAIGSFEEWTGKVEQ